MRFNEWLTTNDKLKEDIWNNKYRNNNETFEEWLDRVSQNNKEYREIIAKKQFLPGGRTLSNIGINDKSSLFNCYSHGFIEDDYAKIMDTSKNIGLTYKSQGGQGVSLSKLRPKGTPIGNRYTSDGIIPFMKIFNEVTECTSQAGSRKGALMISLDAWHKEAEEFITIKSKEGLIQKANLSLEIDDEFMQAVKEYYKNGREIKVVRTNEYAGHKVEYEVTPIKIFKLLVDNSYDYGDPACLFVNRFRNYNIMQFDDGYQIETCNPSLRAGTKVLTTNGIVNIETLENKKFKVFTPDNKIADAECFLSGKNKQLYKITLSNNEEIFCTPEHKWPVLQKDGSYKKKLTKDLIVGEYFQKTKVDKISDGNLGNYEDGFFVGFWYADGSLTKRSDDGAIQYGMTFGSEKCGNIKDIWVNKLSSITGRTYNCSKRNRGGLDWYECSSRDNKLHEYMQSFGIESKHTFPTKIWNECSEDFRRGFIDGLFSGDGTVSSKERRISINSSNYEFIKELKDFLAWYGISSFYYTKNQLISFNGKPQKNYSTTTLTIVLSDIERFRYLFKFTNSKKQSKLEGIDTTLKKNKKCYKNIQIKAIELTDIKEDVWDIHVYDDKHTFFLNTCLTGNCGEQPLPKHGACCLGSINLSEFVTNQYTKNAEFDFDEFEKVVRLAVRYMDSLIDINYNRHPLEEQRQMSFNYRNIGIGVMGYANMLMQLQMIYGTKEALDFTDKLFNLMFRTTVKESSLLAKEKGSFPKYSNVVWKSDIIKNHFTESEIRTLKKQGLRNCSLLSIAPTGTLSNLLGVSGGCEPEFALSFTRRTVGLTNNKDAYYKVYCKSVQEYMEKFKLKDESKLPIYFITSEKIPYINRIATQAVMQKHIDTAISSTINLPENATKQDVADIYIKSWENGLKGITIFRANCQRQAILTTDNKKETKPIIKQESGNTLKRGELIRNDNIIGLKRTLMTGCGTLHCSAYFDKDSGEFVELFLGKGSQGGCLSTLNGLARLTSLSARAGVKLNDIIGQLISANACPSFAVRSATKKDTSKGTCCPSAIANALKEMSVEVKCLIHNVKYERKEEIVEHEKCPTCGSVIYHSNGCVECKNCGWSKCG